MFKHHFCVLAVGVVFIAACGGSSDGVSSAAVDEVDVLTAPEDAQESAEDFVDDIADDLEAVQESQGGGGATLTVDGQTWEFERVLCAFGEDQIGQAGSVFNLSAIGDGLQLYASIDDSGASQSLSLNDIENFENPSVSLSINPFVASALGAPPEFLTLDDKSVSAEVVLMDDITGQPTAGPAQFSGTCP